MPDAPKPPARQKIAPAEWLGFRRDIVRAETLWLGGLIGFGLSGLALVLFLGLLWQLGVAFFTPDDGADVRNIGLVLVALVGAPFIVWRTAVAARQATTAAESLFNDKINAAAEDLAARRQVTEVIGEGDARQVLTLWQDDVVRRAAAIDRLEGLAEERPDAAPRIARMLSVYLREMSRQPGLEARDHPRIEWLRLTEVKNLDADAIERDHGIARKDATVDALVSWARALRPVRSDLEKSAQTLGRLKAIEGVDPDAIPLDLRRTNLQGFDLRESTLQGAALGGARLEGADLFGARMEAADLRGARMEGGNLGGARMEGAYLPGARMEGAHPAWARLEAADLCGARMEGADLAGARLNAATAFKPATLRGAGLKAVDLTELSLDPDLFREVFGDATVKLPEGVSLHPDAPVEKVLDWGEFHDAWRAWQKANGYG